MAQFTLSNQHAAAFDRTAHRTYQKGSMLNGRFYEKRISNAATHQFSNFGKSIALEKQKFQAQAAGDLENAKPIATAVTYVCPHYIDEDDASSTMIDDMMVYGQNIGEALLRRKDQPCFDVLHTPNSDAFGTSPGAIKSGTANVIKPDNLADLSQLLRINGVTVNPGNVTYLYGSKLYAGFAKDDKAASSDYITGQITRTGMMPQMHGMQPIEIEEREEGGLRDTGSPGVPTTYAVERNALGVVFFTLGRGGADIRMSIDWDYDRLGWKLTGRVRLAAARLDNRGIATLTAQA